MFNTCTWCDVNDDFIATLLLSLKMKEFGKSFTIWRIYGQEYLQGGPKTAPTLSLTNCGTMSANKACFVRFECDAYSIAQAQYFRQRLTILWLNILRMVSHLMPS